MKIHRGHVGERDELEARAPATRGTSRRLLARHDDRRRHGGVRRGKRLVRRAGHRRRDRGDDLFSGHAMRTSRRLIELRGGDLLLQLHDAVDQRLGTRRAAGNEHVDRHDLIRALHDGVVVEHAAARRARAHRDHPLRLGHLVVDAAHRRRHLARQPAGNDHQVGLPRRAAEHLGAKARHVVAAGARRHHLDRAAGQAERHRPDRRAARPLNHEFSGRRQDGNFVISFESHNGISSPRPARAWARACNRDRTRGPNRARPCARCRCSPRPGSGRRRRSE